MILTKGTHLYVLDPRTPPYDQLITKLDCPKSITGLGITTPQINTTCLDSEAEEFAPGMPSPSAATISVDYDTAKASHLLIDDLNKNQVIAQWAIGLADGTGAPTGVDSEGDMILPDTRSWILFDGYVADLPFNFALNSTVQSDFTVQPSGRRELIPKNVST